MFYSIVLAVLTALIIGNSLFLVYIHQDTAGNGKMLGLRHVLGIGVICVLIVSFVIIAWPIFYTSKEVLALTAGPQFNENYQRLFLENSLRDTATKIVTGIFFIITAYLAWRQLVNSDQRRQIEEDRKTIEFERKEIDNERQITERFNKAVEHLEGKTTSRVIGGAFALIRIAQDSDKDLRAACLVLQSYIRQHKIIRHPLSPIRGRDTENTREPSATPLGETAGLDIDIVIQSIITAIGDPEFKRLIVRAGINFDLSFCDLSHYSFERLDFSDANFSYSNFKRSKISNATLLRVNAHSADFLAANLNSAQLTGSNLTGASFREADLRNADLSETTMVGARFSQANVENTSFERSLLAGALFEDLSEAEQEQIRNEQDERSYDDYDPYEEEERRYHETYPVKNLTAQQLASAADVSEIRRPHYL